MKEEFLHYLWKYNLYTTPLLLSSGELVKVVNPGEHNFDSGPDFFNAKIKIGETIWAGNVEIHVNASDWKKHKHQYNDAYDSIALHVVANNDFEVSRKNGKIIPTLELQAPKNIYEQYLYLMQTNDWIPCKAFIADINDFTILQSKESLLIERLKEKSDILEQRFKANNNNWEETFYQSLANNFGFKTNAQPFEMLAKTIPLSYLGKHKDQLPLIEAMLFGQSGLLNTESKNEYLKQLETDYKHLSSKFSLTPLNSSLWKFMRLRPANFPTIRIAQFSALIHKSNALFSKLIQANSISDIKELFVIQASAYWDTHYSFKSTSASKAKRLGLSAFYNIVINTIAPMLFYYGQQKNQLEYSEKALQYLCEIPSEQNSIIKKWTEIGLNANNAFDSQALIQLKNKYCKNRKCLSCRIGNQVIKHKV